MTYPALTKLLAAEKAKDRKPPPKNN